MQNQSLSHIQTPALARLENPHIPDEAVPVTPRQAWYITQRDDWDGFLYWNLARLIEPVERLEAALVAQVVYHLLKHHEALRLRLKEDKKYPYHFFASIDEPVPFDYIDLSALSEQEQHSEIEKISYEHQRSINILYGPVFRVTLFDLGLHQPQRLLIIASHTVCDAWSQKILLKDFHKAYTQLLRNEVIDFGPKTTSFKDWVNRRSDYAQSAEFQTELRYWKDLPWDAIQPLPVDYSDQYTSNTRDSICIVRRVLSSQETLFLLRDLHKSTRLDMIDIQMTALAISFTQWTKCQNIATFVVNSGRLSPFKGENLFRTVGNIAITPRLVLTVQDPTDVWKTLLEIQDQLRKVPHNGMMWEWLPLDMTLNSDIAFNYLGQAHVLAQPHQQSWYRKAKESIGHNDDPKSQHWALIVCRTWITDNELHIEWSYSENLYRRTTIEALADAFLGILQAIVVSGRHNTPLPMPSAPNAD